MSPEIIFEDKDVLVINKTAGLMVHGDGRTSERTLTDWIIEKYPEIKGVGEPLKIENGKLEIARPGIVHRLDKDTSGVMIIARNQNSFEFLKKQFQNREVEKKYLALVYDNFNEDEGVIERPIGKSSKDFRQKSALYSARGMLRSAITNWKVLERFRVRQKFGIDFTLLEVIPKTGRTHQIRVHLAAIHHPVVCDKLYAPKKICLPSMKSSSLPAGRQALHASSLALNLPSGERQKFEVPPPVDFLDTIAFLKE